MRRARSEIDGYLRDGEAVLSPAGGRDGGHDLHGDPRARGSPCRSWPPSRPPAGESTASPSRRYPSISERARRIRLPRSTTRRRAVRASDPSERTAAARPVKIVHVVLGLRVGGLERV